MRGRLLTILVAAALAAVAPASAESAEPGQAVLAVACESWDGDVAAVACDPAERLRGSIAFPGAALATVGVLEGEVAVAQVSGDREPLLPGERLTLSVTTPSASARLLVVVAAAPPEGRRLSCWTGSSTG